MYYIEHIIEPEELYLCWMALNESVRKRFVVGKISKKADREATLQYFYDSREVEEAIKMGFRGFPAFQKLEETYTQGVLEAFTKRLPPRNRRDFDHFIEWYGIRPDKVPEMSDFALLGYTGAKVADDGFSLIHPFNTANSFEFLLEVVGFRHKGELSREAIQISEEVKFLHEPANAYDSNAIRVMLNDKLIGYVEAGRARFMKEWMTEGKKITGEIARVNGNPKRTTIYVYVKVLEVSNEPVGG